ncbi:MAG: hypothetical protein ACTHN5_07595 [Phycisphaerae bacterium]
MVDRVGRGDGDCDGGVRERQQPAGGGTGTDAYGGRNGRGSTGSSSGVG